MVVVVGGGRFLWGKMGVGKKEEVGRVELKKGVVVNGVVMKAVG